MNSSRHFHEIGIENRRANTLESALDPLIKLLISQRLDADIAADLDVLCLAVQARDQLRRNPLNRINPLFGQGC